MKMVLKSFSVTLSVLGRPANATYAPGIGDPAPTLVVSLQGATLEEAQGLVALLERAQATDARTALLESKKDELAVLAKAVEAALPKAAEPTPPPSVSPAAKAPKPDKVVKIVDGEGAVIGTGVRNGHANGTAAPAKPVKAEDKVKAAAAAAAKAAAPTAAPPAVQDDLEEADDVDPIDQALNAASEAPEDELEDALLKAEKPSAIFRRIFAGRGMSLEDGTAFLIRNRARLPFFKDLKEPEIAARAKTAHSAVAPAGAARA